MPGKKLGIASNHSLEVKADVNGKQRAHRSPGVRFLYTNASSIRSKWDELALIADHSGPLIIAVAETWLMQHNHIPEKISSRYNVFRQDRGEATMGGVAILASKDLEHRECRSLSSRNTQVITTTVTQPKMFTIACVYRSPTTNLDEDARLLEELDEIVKQTPQIVIVGDSNLPKIDWLSGTCSQDPVGERLIDWVYAKTMYQHVREHTRFKEVCQPSTLDLTLTKHKLDVEKLEALPPLGKVITR